MKKRVMIFAALALANISNRSFAADGTINLTNYDSNNPIMYNPTGVGPSVNLPVANSFVQVLGGPVGGALVVLSSTAPGNPNIFPLVEPGFFDGGFGFVPGVPENAQGQFQVRAWRSAATYDAALPSDKLVSTIYQQAVGTAPSGTPPVPPNPARNQMPAFGIIPEPSIMILGLLGAAVLLFRRRQ